jgi:uncharacterized protein YciI
MKKLITTIVLCIITYAGLAQADNPDYDEKLAASLGGDDYGMKSYIFVILKAGKNVITDKKISDSLFRGHMDNINSLAQSGKLVVAGPLGKNDKTYRGIFILNAKTIEEANTLLQMDPAIKANVFETELFTWYGSAALPEYLKAHSKIEKKKH